MPPPHPPILCEGPVSDETRRQRGTALGVGSGYETKSLKVRKGTWTGRPFRVSEGLSVTQICLL